MNATSGVNRESGSSCGGQSGAGRCGGRGWSINKR